MKVTIDYSNSPAKCFDAVEDIKEYLGKKYDVIARDMAKLPNVQSFNFYCSFAGIEGFPVRAWYDHFHGEGSYDKAMEAVEADEMV